MGESHVQTGTASQCVRVFSRFNGVKEPNNIFPNFIFALDLRLSLIFRPSPGQGPEIQELKIAIFAGFCGSSKSVR